MLRQFENENKKQNKKNLRLKIYGKIRNGRLKMEPSVLKKRKTCKQNKMIKLNVMKKCKGLCLLIELNWVVV